MQLQIDQYRVDIRKVLAENEGVMRETRENYEEKIEQIRRSHQQEVKRLMGQQALEHSTSRVAELQSKVDTQEVTIVYNTLLPTDSVQHLSNKIDLTILLKENCIVKTFLHSI